MFAITINYTYDEVDILMSRMNDEQSHRADSRVGNIRMTMPILYNLQHFQTSVTFMTLHHK